MKFSQYIYNIIAWNYQHMAQLMMMLGLALLFIGSDTQQIQGTIWIVGGIIYDEIRERSTKDV
jgi:hypothetical protein